MLRARIFSTYVTRTPAELALIEIAEAAAWAAAVAAGDTSSVVTEENKDIQDRDVNKFCSQNKQYDPAQEFRREDSGFGRAASTNPYLSIRGEPGSPRGTTLLEMILAVTKSQDSRT